MNPEDKNSASTTVGGVTFGGGASSQPKSENTTPAAAPATSAMPTFENEAKKEDVDPIVASTGDEFDAIMNGIEPAPANAAMGKPTPAEKPAPDPSAQARKAGTLSVIFGILTAIFAIVAVVALVVVASVTAEKERTDTKLAKSETIVKKLEEMTGQEIKEPEDVPVYRATTGYIYISEWNIKIKFFLYYIVFFI